MLKLLRSHCHWSWENLTWKKNPLCTSHVEQAYILIKINLKKKNTQKTKQFKLKFDRDCLLIYVFFYKSRTWNCFCRIGRTICRFASCTKHANQQRIATKYWLRLKKEWNYISRIYLVVNNVSRLLKWATFTEWKNYSTVWQWKTKHMYLLTNI